MYYMMNKKYTFFPAKIRTYCDSLTYCYKKRIYCKKEQLNLDSKKNVRLLENRTGN